MKHSISEFTFRNKFIEPLPEKIHILGLRPSMNQTSQLRLATKTRQNSESLYKAHYHNDVESGSEIRPCNKINKPLVVYRFSGNVMTSMITLRT